MAENEAKEKEQKKWSSNSQYYTALISWTIGSQNIFTTTELLLKGSFLDYILISVLVAIFIGMPLTLIELGISQYCSKSTVGSWNLLPLFRGIGYCKLTILVIFQIYYNALNSYVLLYTFTSFSNPLKWASCDSKIANNSCNNFEDDNVLIGESKYQTSAEQFWFNKVLYLDTNDCYLKWLHGELVGYLCINMFIIFLANCKGIKSLEKVLLVTLILSTIEAFILLFVTSITAGSLRGLQYLFRWNVTIDSILPWNKNSMALDAFRAIFVSMGIGLGGMSYLGAQNSFRQAVHRHAILLNVINILASVMYIIILFNFYGILFHFLNMPMERIKLERKFSSKVFTILPTAMTYLPGPTQIWIFLFYSCIFLRGVSSASLMVSTILEEVYEFKSKLRKFSLLFSFQWSLLTGLLGLVLHSNLGIIISYFLRDLISTTLLPLINSMQILVIVYLYGLGNFAEDFYFMIGRKLSGYWLLALLTSSFLIPSISVLSIMQYAADSYIFYSKHEFIVILQKLVLSVTLSWIPFMALVRIIRKGKLEYLLRSSKTWGPHNNILKKSRKVFAEKNHVSEYVYEKNLLKNKLKKYENNYNI